MPITPSSVYGDLLGRLLSAGQELWRQHQDSDLRTWVQYWSIGLGFLGPASTEAHVAANRSNEWGHQVEGILAGPAPRAALRTLRSSDVEQYHELCLIALSQPLLEALATVYLTSPRAPAGHRPGHHVPLRWPEMLRTLEADASTSASLLTAARLVEVTLGTGRDRLMAHVVPGSLSAGPLRDAKGIKQWSGRIFLEHGRAKEQALVLLKELNSELPADQRSDESTLGIYELGRDLVIKAGRMPVAWGARLQSVATRGWIPAGLPGGSDLPRRAPRGSRRSGPGRRNRSRMNDLHDHHLPRWWPTDGEVTLFDPARVAITRYRFRGAAIPSPWETGTQVVTR